MTSPWLPAAALPDAAYLHVRRRAIFDCDKWDPQVGDSAVVARYPLVMRADAWREVRVLAEALAAETAAAETELIDRPDLHRDLGLPRSVRRALSRAAIVGPSRSAARIIRFDFHFTTDGWRISEANTDVPGGLNEASGFTRLMAPHYPWATAAGDPAALYCQAILDAAPRSGSIALVHATAYSDDLQMMAFLARTLRAAGARPQLVSPAHLRWENGRAAFSTAWTSEAIDLVVRFFPSEWLPALHRSTGWPSFFAGARTPLANPASAILTQSKRFPLVWDRLNTPMPTWRRLLPPSRDPRQANWRRDQGWVLKPVLGRVGEGVGIAGLADATDWRRIRRGARWWPRYWVAQQRFNIVPMPSPAGDVFPCLGVYTVDGRAAGAYGRIGRSPLIDSRAQDAAVLVAA